ncbi:class I adenylate-forming enzyme family protein [Nonomuraea endophytica]|uniref:Fatty-acyl-CoA synthase n=1 Tax=Nonomuraea endophytica TaxID=714136 RepID=A0A7W8ACR4_9ACTN|nr:fatty acid--CoA ligase family protein [Nonomuraea endophytica]MBB5083700.1 fatty-acyl-CoA synthase [Nonomuraea endophytica]
MSTGYVRLVLDGLRSAGPREVLVHGRRRVTGDQALAMAAGAAQALTDRGVRAGQTIACLYGERIESLLSPLVAGILGCRFVPVWQGLPEAVAARVMRELNASALLYDPARTQDLAASQARYPVTVIARLDTLFANPQAPMLAVPDPRDPDDIATVNYSSGTTSECRVAVYSHRIQHAHLTAARALFGDGPRRVLVSPHLRYTGLLYQMWTLAGGGTVIMEPEWQPGSLAEVIRRERVSHLMAGRPSDLYPLVDHLKTSRTAGEHLRMLVYGGAAAVPARIAQAVERLGPRLVQTYGSTEAGFITGLASGDHARPELLASVGRAVPGAELCVRDADGVDLAAGEVGEVWVRSPQLMRGYLGDRRRTGQVLRDGWLRTGDLGRLDDGYLFLLDRTADRLAPGLYSHPIEQLLTSHPAVLDAAVFALPDQTDPIIAGAIVARPGHQVDPEALRALVRTALGAQCEPRHLWLLDELPRTPAGKPDKATLRTRFLTAPSDL